MFYSENTLMMKQKDKRKPKTYKWKIKSGNISYVCNLEDISDLDQLSLSSGCRDSYILSLLYYTRACPWYSNGNAPFSGSCKLQSY